MIRFLLFITIFIFSISSKARAQSNQTVSNDVAIASANFSRIASTYNRTNDILDITVRNSTPITFSYTVNPASVILPSITTSAATGSISACEGSPSASPNLEQFTVSGSNLITDINAAAPTGFEISLSSGNGYSSSLTILQAGGTVNNTVVYVRSAANAAVGSENGNVVLTSGAATQSVGVTATINALPTVNSVPNQTIANGTATTPVNFTGTAGTFNWINNTPSIGLPASGGGDIASFTAVNTGSSPVTATITVTPVPSALAYIASYNGNSVSVVNTATNSIVSKIAVGTNPIGVAISPDGSLVYITNQGAGSVSVINALTNAVAATIPVGDYPSGISVSPDGKTVYVANGGSNTISVINTATNMVTATLSGFSEPGGVTVSPDGSKVYVANEGSNDIAIINTTTNAVATNIPVGTYPIGITISPDGNSVYVVNGMSNSVSVINTTTNAVTGTIPVGSSPHGISISPDGSRIYVVNSNSVSVINTATKAVIATIPVGNGTFGLSVSPDGALVYVPNALDNTVSVISTSTNTVVSTFTISANPESFGNFIAKGAGCSGVPVTFTITVNPSPGPVITATGNLASLNTIYGTASTSTIFTVTGSNLKSGILITPPVGFEVSTDNITFSNIVTISMADANSGVQIYIRLASTTAVGNYSGNIILSSTNATTVNLPMPVGTVNPVTITITANNASKIYGSVNPAFTASFSGFVNNEGTAQLTVLPSLSTAAVTTSPVGQYPIDAAGAVADNYVFVYVPGILTIIPPPSAVVIPNAFTPNGDGINDTWNIKNLESYPNCLMEIYNRYGEKVYSSIGYGIPWDGTYRGASLPAGTYYYIIDLKVNSKVLSGYVAIIR
ncbi:MAG: beta-propeller fold lactonase family protein [Mucilaginibacter sp.]|nr:beta-propeller fold lactonase family protein [Mucilaginibacter sp.]